MQINQQKQMSVSEYLVAYSAFLGKVWDKEEAKDWVITNTQCSNKYSITICGDTQILGGYKCLAKDAQISKALVLPHHWSIRIKVTFWLLDSWDSESLTMKLGRIIIKETRVRGKNDSPLCGKQSNAIGTNQEAVYDKIIDKEQKNDPHYERSVSAVFTTDLDGDASDESFGINNFQILIDPCNPTCDKCLNGVEPYSNYQNKYRNLDQFNLYYKDCLNCFAPQEFYKYYDDNQLCECSKDEFYVSAKGTQCPDTSRNCTIIYRQQGYCKCNDGFYTKSKDVPCKDPVCSTCVKCDAICRQCSGPRPSDCISCNGGKFLQYYSLPDVPQNDQNYGLNLCVDDCINESYFKNMVKLSCDKCDSSCKTCIGSLSSECSTCQTGYFLDVIRMRDDIISGNCVTECSLGYYKNNVTKRCIRCNSNCLICLDQPDVCTECRANLHLKDGKCYVTCPNGFQDDTPNKMCQICDPSCRKCNGGTKSNCTHCYPPMVLFQNQCIASCPQKTYKQYKLI